MARSATALTRWPVIGILPAVRRDPHLAFAALHARDGDIATARVGPVRIVQLGDPEAARALLRCSEEQVAKNRFYRKLGDAFGRGLLTGEGEHWRRHRALVQPLLTPRAVEAYAPAIVCAAGRLVQDGQTAAAAGRPVDVLEASCRFAREVAIAALFGDEDGDPDRDMTEALTVLERWIARRFWALIDPELIPSRQRRAYREAVALVGRRIDTMIARRRAAPGHRDDLLGRLMRARDEAGVLSEQDLRDEATTLYLAGQETTAHALAFTLWQIACHPDVQERLRAEARAVLSEREPAAPDIRALPWTRAAVEETLRLFPPVWALGREARTGLEIGGATLGPGTTVMVTPWLLHRRADLWPEPERFCPARFHGRRPPRAFMPFGAGHRNCVGRDLAMLELILAVALIVRACRLADASPAPVTAKAYASLTPEPAPMLRVEPVA